MNEELKKVYAEYSQMLSEFKDFAENYEGVTFQQDFYNRFDEPYQTLRNPLFNILSGTANEQFLKFRAGQDAVDAREKIRRWENILTSSYVYYKALPF